jgi:hypothetical protein
MTYERFKAYKMKSGKWGFFLDEDCEKLWGPFPTEEAAQEEADRFKHDMGKPERFTAAWKRAIVWMSSRMNLPPESFVDGDNWATATEYQHLPPSLELFELAMHNGSGVRAFAAQAYSFYNTERAIRLTTDELRNLTPFAAAALMDPEGRQIIVDLTMNYAGW